MFAQAASPPIPAPLSERVKLASHIFIGTVTDIWVVDEDGKKVSPEPDHIGEVGGATQWIEILVKVDETLQPGDWHAKEAVRIRFGGGMFGPDQLRKELVGKQLIYLTIQITSKSSPFYGFFEQSYGWNLTEPLEKKSEIMDLINNPSK
jgi:hypothetical protein